MNLFQKLMENLTDVVSLGPRFLFRHASRLTGGLSVPVHIAGVGRMFVRPGDSDVLVVRQVFKSREYDMPTRSPVGARILKRYYEIIRNGRIPAIVDAGANIGAATLWFLRAFPLAHVIAVEPEPGNFAILRKNSANERRITVMEAAIGAAPGFVSVQSSHLGAGARTTRAASGIRVVTMGEAFSHVSNGCPFIAKIDIEGFEYDVFSDNLEWLQNVYVVYIEPHDWLMPGKRTSRTFQRAMAQHDFEIFIRGENLVYVRTA